MYYYCLSDHSCAYFNNVTWRITYCPDRSCIQIRGVAKKFLEGGSKSSKMSSKISDLFQWDFTHSKLSFLAGELFFLP